MSTSATSNPSESSLPQAVTGLTPEAPEGLTGRWTPAELERLAGLEQAVAMLERDRTQLVAERAQLKADREALRREREDLLAELEREREALRGELRQGPRNADNSASQATSRDRAHDAGDQANDDPFARLKDLLEHPEHAKLLPEPENKEDATEEHASDEADSLSADEGAGATDEGAGAEENSQETEDREEEQAYESQRKNAPAAAKAAWDGAERRSTPREPQSHAPDEESIDAYMAKLLNRSRGDKAPAHHPKPAQPVARVETRPVEVKKPVIDAGSSVAAPKEQAAPSSEAAPVVIRQAPRASRPAPEPVDLATMREVANLQARAAIETHQRANIGRRALGRWSFAAAALGCGGVLFFFLEEYQHSKIAALVAVVMAVVLTLLAVIDTRHYFTHARKAAELAAKVKQSSKHVADVVSVE